MRIIFLNFFYKTTSPEVTTLALLASAQPIARIEPAVRRTNRRITQQRGVV